MVLITKNLQKPLYINTDAIINTHFLSVGNVFKVGKSATIMKLNSFTLLCKVLIEFSENLCTSNLFSLYVVLDILKINI